MASTGSYRIVDVKMYVYLKRDDTLKAASLFNYSNYLF